MNVYQQYKREQLALKIQRDIQADIDEEKRIKEAEIRMKEESRLQAIEEVVLIEMKAQRHDEEQWKKPSEQRAAPSPV